jgi:hypothetical protein
VRRGLFISAAGLLIMALAFGILGCGSSSSGSSLTKAEFIKRANAMCREATEERVEAKDEKARELGLKPGEIASPAQHKALAEAALGPYERSTEELQELAPSDQAAKLEPLFAAMEEVAETVRTSPGEINASFPVIQKADELLLRYGLDECKL